MPVQLQRAHVGVRPTSLRLRCPQPRKLYALRDTCEGRETAPDGGADTCPVWHRVVCADAPLDEDDEPHIARAVA